VKISVIAAKTGETERKILEISGKINMNAGIMFVTVVKTEGRNEINPYLLV